MYRERRQSRRNQQAGFTLIELLLVLMILVALGAVAVQFFGNTRDKALIDSAKAQILELKGSIDRYEFDMRKYPSKLEDLFEEPSDDKAAQRWTGPYLQPSKVPVDPWDNEFRFEEPGKKGGKYDVWSLGPDGQDGTDDDIGNW